MQCMHTHATCMHMHATCMHACTYMHIHAHAHQVTTGTIEGQPPSWRLYDNDILSDRTLARRSELLRTEVVAALALGNPSNPPLLLPPGDAAVKAFKSMRAGGLAHLSDLAFEDAERPPGEERPLISLVGDAEVSEWVRGWVSQWVRQYRAAARRGATSHLARR